MPALISKYFYLLHAMRPSYFYYRGLHEFKKRSRLLKIKDPSHSKNHFPVSKTEWQATPADFIFNSAAALQVPKEKNESLKMQAEKILQGKIRYFNGPEFDRQDDNSWLTHPVTGYIYPDHVHWSQFNDFSPERDIKFIWERSRFCYLLTIMRYDHHFSVDHSEFCFNELLSWIRLNPTNNGPNYISSQEIAIRLMNWLFILYYYSASPHLTDERFNTIMQSAYDQLQHIYNNLSFSQHLVRNNHIIAEATALYIYSILFPQLKESKKWFTKSKATIEQEINFQIFDDGTYLQYSMNYHRVVIQMMTLFIAISNQNRIPVSESVIEKAEWSLRFLSASCNKVNGMVPNYGSNDGSLFFPLNNHDYSDFRPQLQALGMLTGKRYFGELQEDAYWFGLNRLKNTTREIFISDGKYSFKDSGYYVFRDNGSLTFIRCGDHKSRPAQADNLHIDLWHNNENIMRDAGTYLYNADAETTKFFFGTASHNTVMLGDNDQMLKGPRFIWYYWTSMLHSNMEENDQQFIFTGSIRAFRQTGDWKIHTRTVVKIKNKAKWMITDQLSGNNSLPLHQIWNPAPNFELNFNIVATDSDGKNITPMKRQGYYSKTYGQREATSQIIFTSSSNIITTTITEK